MNDAYWDFLADIFWPEWIAQNCPTNEDGDPILYEKDDEEADDDDYYKQKFDEL